MSDATPKSALLDDRGVLAVAGGDAREFLQNLVTNDLDLLTDQPAIYAALLSPQGKYLFDFFVVVEGDGGFLLDCEAARLGDLIKRLTMYKLRADVSLIDRSDELKVFAFWDGKPLTVDGHLYPDPRAETAGWRMIAETGSIAAADDFDAHRLALGLSNGSNDIQVDKNFFLEVNGDIQAGVDFDKGCFVGQETTARMKHRDLVRKRLLPIDFAGDAPAPGSTIEVDGKVVGEIRSASGHRALAQLQLSAAAPGTRLRVADVSGTVTAPVGWPEDA